jgi:hypothetical protein
MGRDASAFSTRSSGHIGLLDAARWCEKLVIGSACLNIERLASDYT